MSGSTSSLRLRSANESSVEDPVLVIGVGNPSRGDDALGALAIERLQAWKEAGRLEGVALLTDFQLQPEHVLDLVGRERVIVIDATVGLAIPYRLERVIQDSAPTSALGWTTHQLTPAMLLELYRRFYGEPPMLEVLAVGARSFELGCGLSTFAAANLTSALERLMMALESDAVSGPSL